MFWDFAKNGESVLFLFVYRWIWIILDHLLRCCAFLGTSELNKAKQEAEDLMKQCVCVLFFSFSFLGLCVFQLGRGVGTAVAVRPRVFLLIRPAVSVITSHTLLFSW